MNNILFTFIFASFCVCSFAAKYPQDTTIAIYGEDGRKEVFQVTDNIKKLAHSTVALFIETPFSSPLRYTLDLDRDFFYAKVEAPTLRARHWLCPEVPYNTQLAAASCSGVLVEQDVILTAGHCLLNRPFSNTKNCSDIKVAFDYSYAHSDMNPYALALDNLYQCKEIIKIVREENGPDWALIRLDRRVKKRTPLSVSQYSHQLHIGQELFTIGSPNGIPLKVALGGKVTENSNKSLLLTSLDTFHINSGSPVFNAQTLEIEGIVIKGEEDFVLDNQRLCQSLKVCQKESDCEGETVTRSLEFLDYITQDI